MISPSMQLESSCLPPEVSIIIPVYKTDSRQVQRAVDSALAQDSETTHVEVIVVFDGWSARYASLFSSLQRHPNIQAVQQEHAGVSSARNYGMELARGEWLMFLDADDYLPEHVVDGYFTFLREHNCDVVMGAYQAWLNPSKHETHEYCNGDTIFEESSLARVQVDSIRPQRGISLVWGRIYRREIIVKNKLSFRTDVHFGEDALFNFLFFQHSQKIGYMDSLVYEYCRNSASTVRSFSSDYLIRMEESLKAMREELADCINLPEFASAYNDYVLFHLSVLIVNYVFNPDSQWERREREEIFTKILTTPVFADALGKFSLRNSGFSVTRTIALFAMKHRLYWGCQGIAYVRHKQFANS